MRSLNFIFFYFAAAGMRLSKLEVPGAVIIGENVWLKCDFDLEGDELYSVKWYKNNVEFYRYQPRDTLHGQMYDLLGVYVEVSVVFSFSNIKFRNSNEKF